MMWISVLWPGRPPQEYQTGDQATIGRGVDNDIQLIHPQLSAGRHCRLEQEGEQLFLSDFGSMYPVKLNGYSSSRERQPLLHSDYIELPGDIQLLVRTALDRSSPKPCINVLSLGEVRAATLVAALAPQITQVTQLPERLLPKSAGLQYRLRETQYEAALNRYRHLDFETTGELREALVDGAARPEVLLWSASARQAPSVETEAALRLLAQLKIRQVIVLLRQQEATEAEVIQRAHALRELLTEVGFAGDEACLLPLDDAAPDSAMRSLLEALEQVPATPKPGEDGSLLLCGEPAEADSPFLLGRVSRGALRAGDEVELCAGGALRRARVTWLEALSRLEAAPLSSFTHKQPTPQASVGEAVSCLLEGVTLAPRTPFLLASPGLLRVYSTVRVELYTFPARQSPRADGAPRCRLRFARAREGDFVWPLPVGEPGQFASLALAVSAPVLYDLPVYFSFVDPAGQGGLGVVTRCW